MTKPALPRLLLFCALALLLAGCGSSGSRALRALRNTPNYKAGYSDGCATASAEGGAMGKDTTVRDDALFRADKAYRAGWSGGYGACRPARNGSGGAMPGVGPIPQTGPGNNGLP